MSLDEALDQLAREVRAGAAEPDATARLQAAMDELVNDARHWAIQTDLLRRRLHRNHEPDAIAPPTRSRHGHASAHAPAPDGANRPDAGELDAALDELARQAVASLVADLPRTPSR